MHALPSAWLTLTHACLPAGGSAAASEAIHREVSLLVDAGRPVVVSMGNVAASGDVGGAWCGQWWPPKELITSSF